MQPLFPELPEIAGSIANPTADDYATAAKYAFKRKQRPLAVQQVAAALALDPRNFRYLQLLSDIVGTTPDPMALLRLRPEGTFFGLAAARAWMLAKQTHATEAALLIAEVVRFQPNVPFLVWLREWQERFEWTERVSPDVVVALIRGLVTALLSKGLEVGGDENLNAVMQAAEALQRRHPKHASLLAARMWTHRRLGETDGALALASAAPVAWETELERARALRSVDKRDDEVSALQKALTLAPDQASLYLELAQTLVHLGCRAEAESVLRQSSSDAPSESGNAALAYLEWLASNSSSPPEFSNGDAAQLFSRDARCYRDILPDPNDEAVGVVRGALKRATETQASRNVSVRATVNHRAAPSAMLAFELGLAAMGKEGELVLASSVKSNALGELWSSTPRRPAPLLAPPEDRLVTAIASMAHQRFEWQTWLESARRIATEQPRPIAPLDVVSVALHPPAAPAMADAVQWLTHVHVAVAMLLGALNGTPEREHAISRCLAATDDWVCNVGIVALYAAVAAETKSSEAACAQLAALLQATDLRSCCARTLGIIGMLICNACIERFSTLRAQVAFEGLVAD